MAGKISERQRAAQRVSDTKDTMDQAQAALEKAEDEWHQACIALDRLDGHELPTAADVRGILK